MVLLLLPFILHAQEFSIDTSRGPQTVTIPEGMSFEEAFLTMAGLYLEERFDLEEALEQVDALTEEIEGLLISIDNYIEMVDYYESEVERLLELYENALRTAFLQPYLSVGGGIDLLNRPYGELGLGISLFEMWFITADVRVPLQIGLTLGRTF